MNSLACPDWRALAAGRDLENEREGAAWSAALVHLNDGCRACRDAAYAADPTLVFQRLPQVTAGPDETADLTSSVRAMIRAGRVEGSPSTSRFEDLLRDEFAAAADQPEPRLELRSATRPAVRWRIASVAAALVALLVGTAPAPVDQEATSPTTVASAALTAWSPSDILGNILPVGDALSNPVASDPVEIETLDRPSANVYQFDDPGMAVVLIVDSGLDV